MFSKRLLRENLQVGNKHLVNFQLNIADRMTEEPSISAYLKLFDKEIAYFDLRSSDILNILNGEGNLFYLMVDLTFLFLN